MLARGGLSTAATTAAVAVAAAAAVTAACLWRSAASKAQTGVAVTLVTAPDGATARSVAKALVEAQAAACVNILPGLSSVYSWEGEIHEDSEVLLVIKTRNTPEALARAEAIVSAEHPYDVPEFVSLQAVHVEAKYADWLYAATLDEPSDGSRGPTKVPSQL